MTNNTFSTIGSLDLSSVVGGAGFDINAVRDAAQPYCPQTVQKYGNLTSAQVTRPVAQRLANECLAEIGPGFTQSIARGRMQSAIDQAFPPKR